MLLFRDSPSGKGTTIEIRRSTPLVDRWTDDKMGGREVDYLFNQQKGGCTEPSLEPDIEGSAESFLRGWQGIQLDKGHGQGQDTPWSSKLGLALEWECEDQARCKALWTPSGESHAPVSGPWASVGADTGGRRRVLGGSDSKNVERQSGLQHAEDP